MWTAASSKSDRRFLLGASLAYVHKPHEASRDKAGHLPPDWGKRFLNQLAIGRVISDLSFSGSCPEVRGILPRGLNVEEFF